MFIDTVSSTKTKEGFYNKSFNGFIFLNGVAKYHWLFFL
jgi:hypothetical protein